MTKSSVARDPKGTPLADRIRSKSKLDPATGCWDWLAHKTDRGYGRLQVEGRQVQAHRASYAAFRGPIPDGLVIDHLCRNRACVNPDHMEPVTAAENTRRGLTSWALRQGLCAAGLHDITSPEAVRVRADGGRQCVECRRLRDAERYAHDPDRPNVSDANRIKTHCIHGHEFTPENTRMNGTKRQCKTCQSNYDKGRRR